jgi:hypothetical protein
MRFLGINLSNQPSRKEICKANGAKYKFGVEQLSLEGQSLASNFAHFNLSNSICQPNFAFRQLKQTLAALIAASVRPCIGV